MGLALVGKDFDGDFKRDQIDVGLDELYRHANGISTAERTRGDDRNIGPWATVLAFDRAHEEVATSAGKAALADSGLRVPGYPSTTPGAENYLG